MTKPENRRGGVSKLARTETVTVRLDSKLRYLADLAARAQRRTVSSFIEWAIQTSLEQVRLGDPKESDCSAADESETLWDVDEADRFAKLAFRHPNLMTYEEQVLWKLIRENGYLWKGTFIDRKWVWEVGEASLDLRALRRDWAMLAGIAGGERPDEWFLEKRAEFKNLGGHVYENSEGYFLADDEGTVLVDKQGHVHISPGAIENAEEHGKKVALKVKKDQGSMILADGGMAYADGEGNVYEIRRGTQGGARKDDGRDS
jgi:hypothetical protein